MNKLRQKITSHQGLIKLKPHQSKTMGALITGIILMSGSAFYLLVRMRAFEVTTEASRLMKYFGEAYLYIFLLGLCGFFLVVYSLLKLLRGTKLD